MSSGHRPGAACDLPGIKEKSVLHPSNTTAQWQSLQKSCLIMARRRRGPWVLAMFEIHESCSNSFRASFFGFQQIKILVLVFFPLVWHCEKGLKRVTFCAQKGSQKQDKKSPPKIPNQTEKYRNARSKVSWDRLRLAIGDRRRQATRSNDRRLEPNEGSKWINPSQNATLQNTCLQIFPK